LAAPQVQISRVQQQDGLRGREGQRAAVVRKGVVGIAAAQLELRGGLVSRGHARHRSGRAAPRVLLELRNIVTVNRGVVYRGPRHLVVADQGLRRRQGRGDRKSTRLNSSHQIISYAVFCLKKKNKKETLRVRSKDRGTQ